MFAEMMKRRRSIRRFENRTVEPEKIDVIMESALRSPSGRAARPWHFVVVTDKGLLEKLSVAKPGGASFLKDAPLGIVVCGDPNASRLWVEDCTIAAIILQLAAQDLCLGSRWSHMRGNKYNESKTSRDYIAELLGLPENLDVECIIAIGYPAEEMVPYKKEDLHLHKVSYNRFG